MGYYRGIEGNKPDAMGKEYELCKGCCGGDCAARIDLCIKIVKKSKAVCNIVCRQLFMWAKICSYRT